MYEPSPARHPLAWRYDIIDQPCGDLELATGPFWTALAYGIFSFCL